MTDPKNMSQGITRNLTNYGDPGFAAYLRRSFARSMGYSLDSLSRPIIGIATSPSGFNNCHRSMPDLVEAVKRGVLKRGGLPIDFPTISLGEVFLSPTSMMFRNLMSMDVEEMLKAQPIDACVVIGGCDKTVPAQLMGIASANIPSIQLVTGPMLAMPFEGEQLGACTDCRRFWGKYRAGEISDARINDIEGKLATTAGTCAVMGTASTMACITEVLGMSLPGGAAIPAVHADRLRLAEACGERAMEMAVSGSPLPQQIITSKAIENALTVLLAISGSTNAVVHLAAIAGRCGIDLPLETINRISDETPVLVNLKPTGDHYMQDLFAAGGLTAVLHELKHQLHLDCLTVTGETLGHWLSEPPKWVDRNVIRKFNEPYQQEGGLIALFGTLAPTGAIIKRGAADSRLFERTGRAVVFESLEDLSSRIDSEELDVTEDDFLVLKNAGPKSASCMPEAGYLPIPKKLAARGVKDMVRISDARMSGTAFGTVVLHVSPDASSGGSLAFVRTGDQIRLSVKEKKLDLLVSEEELALRQRNWKAPDIPGRGYARLYYETVTQAPLGCDFNFLRYNQKR